MVFSFKTKRTVEKKYLHISLNVILNIMAIPKLIEQISLLSLIFQLEIKALLHHSFYIDS